MVLTSLEQSLLVFKVLSDPNRLRLYWLLTHVGAAICVCEAMRVLDLPQYETSKHLKQLREAGLVEAEKRGRFCLLQGENSCQFICPRYRSSSKRYRS